MNDIYNILSRNSGLNGGQSKSCFGFSMPSPMLFTVPAEVVEACLIWPKEGERRAVMTLRQQILIDPRTLGVPVLLSKSHSGWREHPTKETSYSIRLDNMMIYFVLINIYRVS